MSANKIRLVKIFALFLALAGIYNAAFYLYQQHQARDTFVQRSPCPANGIAQSTCPGWVIAYEVPLCAGGSEEADNMQWQTTEEADKKAKAARKTCFPHFR